MESCSDRYHGPFYNGHHSDRRFCMSDQQEWGGKGAGGLPEGVTGAFVLSEPSLREQPTPLD